MTWVVMWERKGLRCVVDRGYRSFNSFVGLPLGHPYYGVRRKSGNRRFAKKYARSLTYAGYIGRGREWWYLGYYLQPFRDIGYAIQYTNRMADRLAPMLPRPQTQTVLKYESTWNIPPK